MLGFVCASAAGQQSLVAAGASAARAAQSVASAQARIVREIRDPQTGAHWLVVPSTENPAGPGRMIAAPPEPRSQSKQMVIHNGDTLLVEERTQTVETCLAAVALGPAAMGSEFRVRLKVGGRVLKAVAVAPGRAALVSRGQDWGEAWR